MWAAIGCHRLHWPSVSSMLTGGRTQASAARHDHACGTARNLVSAAAAEALLSCGGGRPMHRMPCAYSRSALARVNLIGLNANKWLTAADLPEHTARPLRGVDWRGRQLRHGQGPHCSEGQPSDRLWLPTLGRRAAFARTTQPNLLRALKTSVQSAARGDEDPDAAVLQFLEKRPEPARLQKKGKRIISVA